MRSVRLFFDEIRIEHTLFALPFAYAAALLAKRGVPPLSTLFWITIAVLGARTAAMSANRLLDARFDAKNPRTAGRALASGKMQPSVLVWTTVIGSAVLAFAAAELNPLCLALAPLGAVALVLYPLVKRWTWGVHFLLGAVDALAPLGAWLAVTGKFSLGAILLFAAVTLWVAGFDILYALMDREFDVRERLHSIPVRFGERSARSLPPLLHGGVVAALACLGWVVGAPQLYWLGVAAAVVLVAFEIVQIARQRDDVALNQAVFNANMAFSVVFLITTAASFVMQGAG